MIKSFIGILALIAVAGFMAPGTAAATFEDDQCVPMEKPEPKPQPTPQGGGSCMNCGDDEEEEEEIVELDEEEIEEMTEEELVEFIGPACPRLIEGFIKLGGQNNIVDVFVLQKLLNDHMGENLKLDGTYDADDYEAVKRFQARYYQDIISPWHTYIPGMGTTGYVFRTTKWKINTILCPSADIPLPVVDMS